MAEITAKLVKDLREKTGAGMMDCKKALTETTGELEQAVDWLRKNGLATAAKKAGRIAAEGLVAIAASAKKAAVVEVNSETDFVARNNDFQEFVRNVAAVALAEGGDVEKIAGAALPEGQSVGDGLTALAATIGENMTLRRAAELRVGSGVVSSYIHGAVSAGLGRIGVLVALESDGDAEKLNSFGHQLAMHIAAASPQWVSIDEVSTDDVERERNVLAEQARASGKPEEIVQKMVEGRLRKYYEEVVLTEQTYVIDSEIKVAKAIEEAGKEAGAPVNVTGFCRFALGEGIDRKEEDFAAEVAATMKQ